MKAVLDRELVRFSWQALRSGRKFQFAALVSAIPLVVGVILFFNDASNRNGGGPSGFRPAFTDLVASLVLTATVPFLSLLLAGGLLADEVEDRTLTYLLVRPIPRRVLYASKAVPVLAAAAGFGALQALLLGLARLGAAFAFGSDTLIPYLRDGLDAQAQTISAPLLVLRVLPSAILACALEAAVLAAVFGLVSLLTTRFHFLANLLLFGAWEFPFARLGGVPSYLTAGFWSLSLLGAADPTSGGQVVGSPASPYLAAPWLLGAIAFWVYAGMWWIPRRGFNVASATA